MAISDYYKYIIYAVGFSSIAYILLIIFRHLILYYIMQSLSRIAELMPKFKKNNKTQTDREDGLMRNEEKERFKQQASEISNQADKEKEDDDTIEVEVERTTQTTGGVDDVFKNTESRLEMAKETEVIVGYAKPVGKWTSLVLGKKLSQIASIMEHQAKMGMKPKGYWSSYIGARNEAEGRVKDILR